MAQIAKPFVKWAGGKRQLLPEIFKYIPAGFGRYYEPFVGGGALFFELHARGLIGTTLLGDKNEHLIRAYIDVRGCSDTLISALSRHAKLHSERHYYAVRDLGFDDTVESSARFIYLNRTGFNGLYRVNKRGGFNVPFGRYTNPTICDEENIRACALAFRAVAFAPGIDFQAAVAGAKSGDLVYFDPPYWPKDATADFTAYTAGGFGPDDQARLRDVALRLKARGVHVILSNADVPPIRKLYAKGFKIHAVEARRAINSKATARGTVGEVIIT